MKEQIKISAKNLGALALPNYCPRCQWIKLKLSNKLPFQIFPGIFSSIDSYTKRIVENIFDQNLDRPNWLKDFGEFTGYFPVPHWSKFNMLIEKENILLNGGPDFILVKPDGSWHIIDFKTAKFTDTQDELLPMYQTQLNCYALIAESLGHKVTNLDLIYFEPINDKGIEIPSGYYSQNGFALGFSGHVKNIKIDKALLNLLFAELRSLYDLEKPPEGKSGCKDCDLLNNIISLLK